MQKYFGEYIGADINKSFLLEAMEKFHQKHALFIASNLYHLPFADSSVSSIVMIRVFNFASQPLQVIRELSRVIVPRGFLIISVNPKPSLATLVDDIKHHAYNENPSFLKLKSVTFSRENTSQIFPASFSTFAHKRKFTQHLFETNGFTECTRISSGLEDYSFMKFLPMKFFLAIGSIFNKFSVFPTTFFLLQKNGALKESLPAIQDILQCPRCGTGLPNHGPDLTCGECGASYKMEDDILDITYLPGEAKIAE